MNLWQQIRTDWRWYRHPTGKQVPYFPLRIPGFWLLACYRLGAWSGTLRLAPLRFLVRVIYVILNFFISAATSADIRPHARIGQRFTIHTTRGLLITNKVQIGDDCIVNTGVCIVGRADGRGRGVPRIGNGVMIGVGAKLLGEISVGDHCIIGANAVVIRDVPDDCLAVGVPAKIKPIKPPQAGQD